jgi:hypothetical protein
MGYYLTEHLVTGVADDLAAFVDNRVVAGLVVTVIVSDVSYRADWGDDKTKENPAGKFPLVLLERTYGNGDMNARAEMEEMTETGLLMMDREGVPLDALFTNLPQNVEAGDLFPSSDAVGVIAGHLAIVVVGLDRDSNTQIMIAFQQRILQAIALELSEDDDTTDSFFVGAGSEDHGDSGGSFAR